MNAWDMIEQCLIHQHPEFLGRPIVERATEWEMYPEGLLGRDKDVTYTHHILPEEPMGDPGATPLSPNDEEMGTFE